MSVIGIDFGNDTCFVAVARGGGIETVDNDYSMRATPSFVAFGERQRILGVAAKSQAITNLKNTVFGFKRYLGRFYDDPQVQEDIKRVPFKVVETSNGRVGMQVMFQGKEQIFTPEQMTAMLFTKLKETTETAIQAKVHDCVISVPSYFTDAERRALMDAAQIAGLNVLRLMNDTIAAALNYGIYKQDLPEPDAKPRNVVIVECGHSAIQVSISAFNKGKLKVLASTADPYLGGRNFDGVLATHFCTEFRTKYGIDAETNPRAYMRLLTEVEKLKKQMSANATKLPLNIECFMEEKDVSSSMCRADFEQMSASLLERVKVVLEQCLSDSKLDVNDIHSVEIVGGSTRIPAIKSLIEKVFNKVPSTTLNQDEAVARGCALQCAILSPAFKVRDFSITDVQPYPIKLIWDETLGEDGSSDVFPQYHPIPFSRMLTFSRKTPMNLTAVYAGPVPFTTTEIGKYAIDCRSDAGEACKISLKVRVDMNGIFNIRSAKIYEKVEVSESDTAEQPMEAEPAANADSGSPAANNESEKIDDKENPTDAVTSSTDVNMEEAKKGQSNKVHYKARDLPVDSKTFGLSRPELEEMMVSETLLISRDRNEKERLDSKNALEEYVYDLREKLEMDLSSFVQEQERQTLTGQLSALENWLYEEGSDVNKEVYIEKIKELKNQGEPIKERRLESEERPRAFKEVDIALQLARKVVDLYKSKDPKYDHINPKEMEKVMAAINETESWLQNSRMKFMNHQPYMPVPVKAKEILEQRRLFEAKVNPIINTPKPKVEPPKEDSQKKEKDDSNTKKPAESTNASANHTEKNATGDPQAMEVE